MRHKYPDFSALRATKMLNIPAERPLRTFASEKLLKFFLAHLIPPTCSLWKLSVKYMYEHAGKWRKFLLLPLLNSHGHFGRNNFAWQCSIEHKQSSSKSELIPESKKNSVFLLHKYNNYTEIQCNLIYHYTYGFPNHDYVAHPCDFCT